MLVSCLITQSAGEAQWVVMVYCQVKPACVSWKTVIFFSARPAACKHTFPTPRCQLNRVDLRQLGFILVFS